MVRAYRLLRNWIRRHPTDLLLLESFSEYLSPFWVHHLVALKRGETKIGANLHDPVRNFVVGPHWWHAWSVKLAYKPIDFVLVHQPIPAEAGVPEQVVAHEVPVGIYEDNTASIDKMEAKRLLKIPKEARTFLSFGFIRDNKNLDLFIQAMPGFPDIYLVVAGRNQSQSDKPIDYYRSLAKELGVDDRIRFDTHFISNEEIPIYFSAADQILLTYSNQFRSQSGVLCIAGNYRKPVFASSGDSPLKDCVKRFNLGNFVNPDNVDEITEGLRHPLESLEPDWDGFFEYSSWSTNIAPISSMLKAPAIAQ